jgi:MFS family permease
VKSLFREVKHVKSWIVYASLAGMPVYLAVIYWALFAAEVKAADQYVIGQMTMAMWVIPILFSFPMGKLADVIGRKRAIYLLTPLSLVSMFMLIPQCLKTIYFSTLQCFLLYGMLKKIILEQQKGDGRVDTGPF